ncbi:hypothetical protein FISHEDRAFT_68653 [Fistulina hepatica ATCC 64428]|uniref:Uncharacterized protein n=1 Tax=Fistulina hepatica ATCC 64428 TaxID=1128425 RepID=A0A0D7AQX1_9AGAR|nr:hypothetical protein FISHEDRAFT_68653 [Fistulina hepatica ATCC 64428]
MQDLPIFYCAPRLPHLGLSQCREGKLLAVSFAKNFSISVGIGFLIGLADIGAAEAAFYAGVQYVLRSWYKSTELGQRACLFHVVNAIGPMFRLFIIDGIITIPTGILGFIIMPNLHNTKPLYIYTEEQPAMARKQMDEIGRHPATGVFTKEKIEGFFTTRHIWMLVLEQCALLDEFW